MTVGNAGKDNHHLSLQQARKVAMAAQGLHRGAGSLVDILERTGFIRTLGGADVYLAARARVPGLSRKTMDAAAQAGDIRVVPTVRGCIYLVTADHVPASLRLADLLSKRRAEREHEKAGIRAGELEAVGEAVVAALGDGPAGTQAIRKRLPDGLVRGLGEAGKKVGISSPLPPALRRLEFDGIIERLLDGGRLDTERYVWALTAGDPFQGLDSEAAAIHVHMARVYLRSAGFGTQKGFAAWSGLGQRDAKKALAGFDTVSVTIDGLDEPFIALRDQLEELDSTPIDDAVAFLPFEDNLLAFRQGPAFFVDPEHGSIPVPVWGRGKGSTLGDVRHAALRPIIAESRMVGFWELDPDTDRLVTGIFADISTQTRDRIEHEASEIQSFLVDQIGHGRSLSIDSEKHMLARCAYIAGLTS